MTVRDAHMLRPSDRARMADRDDDRDDAPEVAARPRAVGRWTQVDVRDGRTRAACRRAPGRTTRVLAELDIAELGVSEPGGALPYLPTLQRAFGDHDLSTIEAHIGGAARDASARLGADAYAFGRHIAFASAPALQLVAHEVAHVLQQRAGLATGVGRAGDAHEQHADLVAARVVAGMTVAHLFGSRGTGGAQALQCQRSGSAPIAAGDPDGSIATEPSPSALAAARHDGSASSPLGSGDEVFDADNHVIVVFPATAEGVVLAAQYELHRSATRSLDAVMHDQTERRTRRGEHAAIEVLHGRRGNDDDDPTVTSPIGTFRGRRVGPIAAYQRAAGVMQARAWCGCFATFVYMRCGLLQPGQSLASAVSVPSVLAHLGSDEARGQIYRFDGEVDAHHHYAGAVHAVTAHGTGRGTVPATAQDLDIRPGDVFWNEYPPEPAPTEGPDTRTDREKRRHGHVGIIIGVHRTPQRITLVTVEGNSDQRVQARVRVIDVGAHGRVTSDIKGWGRPPALVNSPVPARDGDMPSWMAAARDRPSGDHATEG